MSDENLMTLEHDDGTTPTPPPDPTPVATAPEPATTPEPPEQAAAPAAEVADPQPAASAPPQNPHAGILRELAQTRERERQWREVAQAGVQLAQRIDSDPKLKAAVYGHAQPAQPEADAPVAERHELEQVARQNVWYDKDGNPDLNAASNFLKMLDQRASAHAERIVAERLAPFQRTQVQQTATGRRAEALAVAQQLKIPQATAESIFDGLMATNPELLADPQTATMAVLAAAGLHYVQQQHGGAAILPTPAAAAPAAPRPTFVEQGQGARPANGSISALGTKLAKAAGVGQKAWQTVGSAYDTQANRTLMRFDSEEDK